MFSKNSIFLLIFALILIGCQSAPPNYPELARNLNDQMENAFKKGAMKQLAAIYSDDGYLLSPNRKPIHGRKAIDAYWERWHSPINWELDVIAVGKNEQDIYESDYWKNMVDKPKHWKEEGITIRNEKVFYQLGHSKIEYESDDAVHQTSHVDFILVWKLEEDGEYRIWIDTYN